jgi:hypothetical protein
MLPVVRASRSGVLRPLALAVLCLTAAPGFAQSDAPPPRPFRALFASRDTGGPKGAQVEPTQNGSPRLELSISALGACDSNVLARAAAADWRSRLGPGPLSSLSEGQR